MCCGHLAAEFHCCTSLLPSCTFLFNNNRTTHPFPTNSSSS
jgi:hypothetical protein